MTKLPISVFIIAHNEADRIGNAIKSVTGWADEVIVIDSGSTDETIKVSESLGAHTFHNAWQGYGLQKRFGEDQCKNRWLLNLDADEEITPALAEEIHQLFSNGEPPYTGYILKIRDLLPGEQQFAPLSHTNYGIRFYNREKARFSDSPVHDSVIVRDGTTIMLKHPVMHRSFRGITHAIGKMNSYTSAQARELLKKELAWPRLRLATELPVAFFKAYILRLYILRGWRGFVYAALYAFGRFIRIAKYLELKNRN
jgi:glycosyltransferase involved in cell wall biosynthesis